jgi:dolichol-phosphate mannosyltransferase
VRVLSLSRNFGHQLAITAGLDHADGDAVVVIDADLQDPPELIPQMVARWREGHRVVYGTRVAREGETALRLWAARVFYRLLRGLSAVEMPEEAGDFRLIDRRVVEVLKSMPERDRFIRGLVSWAGFRQVSIPYRRESRSAGRSNYSLSKLSRLALDGITGFSVAPLRLITWLGVSVSLLSIVGIFIALASRLFGSARVGGAWTLIWFGLTLLGGFQLASLGVVGEYVGQIYREVKSRPAYLVQERLGFVADGDPQTRVTTASPAHRTGPGR